MEGAGLLVIVFAGIFVWAYRDCSKPIQADNLPQPTKPENLIVVEGKTYVEMPEAPQQVISVGHKKYQLHDPNNPQMITAQPVKPKGGNGGHSDYDKRLENIENYLRMLTSKQSQPYRQPARLPQQDMMKRPARPYPQWEDDYYAY